MLGFFEEFKPKFVRRYLNGAEMVRSAVKKYVEDVNNGKFPSDEEIY
jgi:3-methyl-2-oxobutanoate hydroxymethyltransferase